MAFRLLILLAMLTGMCRAQFRGANWVYDSRIRTAQLFRGEDQLADPILMLGAPNGDFLTLSFDWLGTEGETLAWTLIHCNSDWRPSNLLPTEFYNGFPTDPLPSLAPSRQTRVPYIHYESRIPSATSGGGFRRSGNYLLVVHPAGRPRDTLMTRRFLVAEQAVAIGAQVAVAQAAVGTNQRFQAQQVNFSVNTARLNPSDPSRELKAVVLQNFRWDLARVGLRPTFVRPGQVDYLYDATNTFSGGNEFRQLDLRSAIGRGMTVARLTCNEVCVADIIPDQPLTQSYLSRIDLNGKFYLGSTGVDREIGLYEADYWLVNLSLRIPQQPDTDDLYVLGPWNDWAPLPANRLQWDARTATYQTTLQLKQAIYNYQYAIRRPSGWDLVSTEGNWFETENQYTILVYYRLFGDRADRLVGIQTINTAPGTQR